MKDVRPTVWTTGSVYFFGLENLLGSRWFSTGSGFALSFLDTSDFALLEVVFLRNRDLAVCLASPGRDYWLHGVELQDLGPSNLPIISFRRNLHGHVG